MFSVFYRGISSSQFGTGVVFAEITNKQGELIVGWSR